MKKINFRKNHIIIPLFIFPFILAIYFIFFYDKEPTTTEATAQTQQAGLNTELPNAKDNIETPDRLEAYQEAVRKRRMNSGVNNLDETEKKTLEKEGQAQVDSLRKAFSAAEKTKLRRKQATDAAKKSAEALMAIREKSQSKTAARDNKARSTRNVAALKENLSGKQANEMQSFKNQMLIIDSIQNPEKYAAKAKLLADQQNSETEAEEKAALQISKTNNRTSNTNYFNTIQADHSKTMISGILDEGIKAWEGSRVRIRLLEPIFLDGRLLDKGQYLYGIVTAFKTQRLIIEISSVMIEDQILPMNVSLYDNDGIEGIYIPDSSFRTFSKELGVGSTNSQVQLQNGPNNNSQAIYQSLTNAVRSSTRAVQRALRKNKATLKYNTQVYLVNNNK